jgi:hypothetical protein
MVMLLTGITRVVLAIITRVVLADNIVRAVMVHITIIRVVMLHVFLIGGVHSSFLSLLPPIS